MGAEGEPRALSLSSQLWPVDKMISAGENLALELTSTPDELDEVLSSMKQDTPPGPGRSACGALQAFLGKLEGPHTSSGE
jgi:hypothetical protein